MLPLLLKHTNLPPSDSFCYILSVYTDLSSQLSTFPATGGGVLCWKFPGGKLGNSCQKSLKRVLTL